MQKETVGYRRFFHANAEVGLTLPKTERYIVDVLRACGYAPVCIDGGVFADIGKGEKILLRADCDALPIREQTRLPFACKRGNMHACGHDLHASALLTCAKLLKKHERLLQGGVRLFFQFGEELLQGAKKAVDAGVLDGVMSAYTLHATTDSPLPVGRFILPGTGEIAPCAHFFSVRFQGKSTHGSTPETGADALLAGAKFAVDSCMLPAREVSPSNPAVLTLGSFYAGVAPNALADNALLQGTLRAWDSSLQEQLLKRLRTLVSATAKACRVQGKLNLLGHCPTLKNDESLRQKTATLLADVFGKDAFLSADGQRGGGSEDFAYISTRVPSCFVAVCAGEHAKGFSYPLHHPKTTFDENALPYLSALFCAWALQNR